MATSDTTFLDGVDVRAFDVTATLDGDTTHTIAHGLADTPGIVILTPILQAPAEASAWALDSVDATNIVVRKGTGAGSGDAAAQLRVIAIAPETQQIG